MSWFDLPKLIRTQLLANTDITNAVGQRVHYQHIPGDSELPHVWFTRQDRNDEDCVNGERGLRTERYAFEVVASDECESLVDALVAVLEGLQGTVGDRELALVDIEEAGDDYLFRSVGEEDAEFLHAITVTCYIL